MGRPKKQLVDETGSSLMPQIIAEYLSGMTLMELAAKYNTCDMTIHNRLKEAGIPSRPRHRRYGRKVQPRLGEESDTDFEERVNSRRAMGLNDYEISRFMNISVKDVMKVKKHEDN